MEGGPDGRQWRETAKIKTRIYVRENRPPVIGKVNKLEDKKQRCSIDSNIRLKKDGERHTEIWPKRLIVTWWD